MEQPTEPRILRMELTRKKGSNYVARVVLDEASSLERKVEGNGVHSVAQRAVEAGWIIDQYTQYQTIKEPSYDAVADIYQDPATGKEFSEFYYWYNTHKKMKASG